MNFKKANDLILDIFFPKFCLGCRKEGLYICDDCRSILDINESIFCLCEQNPHRYLPLQNTYKCRKCENKKLSGVIFALHYDDKSQKTDQRIIKKLIHSFKYKPYLKDLAETMASFIIEHLIKIDKNSDEYWAESVLIPVPIHIKKFRIRGYNQSEELSKELSKILKIPVLLNVLSKNRETSSQMSLKKDEREKNLANVFVIKNPAGLAGKKVFLVDDVYTTGATLQECAKVLRQSGVKSVWGITIARGT